MPFEVIQEIRGRCYLFAVEASPKGEDYQKYEVLRMQIWDDPDDRLAGGRNMASANYLFDGSSLFIAAYQSDLDGSIKKEARNLAAFAYGYVGVEDKIVAFRDPANLIFYSQYAAVRPDLQNCGLGVRLKQFQAEQVKQLLGVKSIACTFDPLVGINAYRNLHILGMEVRAYKDAYYEGFGGRLNRLDVSSDRFLAVWYLDVPHKSPAKIEVSELLAAGHSLIPTELRQIQGKSRTLNLPVALDLLAETGQATVLIEIPYDYYTMLQETDVTDASVRDIPLQWRRLTRKAFHSLFQAGYKVFDFVCYTEDGRMRDFYVLHKK